MKTRTITTVLVLSLLIFIISLGKMSVFTATFIATIIALNEFYAAFSKRYRPVKKLAYLGTFALYFIYFSTDTVNSSSLLLIFSCFVLLSVTLFTSHTLADAMVTIFGMVYIMPAIFIVNVILEDYGYLIFILALIIAVSTDIFAYATGKLFGRHKLISHISPNKTIEGAAGGLVFCVITSGAYAWFFLPELFPFVIPISALGSAVSQLGDLISSKIKRDCQIKDFGFIFPGHGGILDRLDSLIVIFPFIEISMRMVMFYFYQ